MTKRRKTFQKTFFLGIASSLFFFYGCGNPKGLTWDKDPTLASPTNFSATVQNQNQINISWTWSNTTGAQTPVEFLLEFSNDSQKSWLTLPTLEYPTSPSPFTVSHTGSFLNQTLIYRLKANNSSSSSQALIYGPITISSNPTQPTPSTPNDPSATSQTDQMIQILWSWTDSRSEVLPVTLGLYYGSSSSSITNLIEEKICNSLTACSYETNHSGLASNTKYYYQVKASNGAGFTLSAFDDSTTQPTPQPTLTIKIKGPGTVSDGLGTTFAPVLNAGVTTLTKSYNQNSVVTLTGVLSPTYSSTISWGGSCSGTSTTCSLTMNQNKTVEVSFTSTIQLFLYSGLETVALDTTYGDDDNTFEGNPSEPVTFNMIFTEYTTFSLTASGYVSDWAGDFQSQTGNIVTSTSNYGNQIHIYFN